MVQFLADSQIGGINFLLVRIGATHLAAFYAYIGASIKDPTEVIVARDNPYIYY